jgi:hypothetical protein
MTWQMKGTRSFPLLVLHTFYKQRMLMTLQHVQTISISSCVVVITEGSFRLNILSRGPLFDMFLMTEGGLGIGCFPCGSPS